MFVRISSMFVSTSQQHVRDSFLQVARVLEVRTRNMCVTLYNMCVTVSLPAGCGVHVRTQQNAPES